MAAVLFIFFIQPRCVGFGASSLQAGSIIGTARRDLRQYRDLRFEYRAGKYSEGDYEAMKTSLEMEVAQVLLEIDQVTESQTKRPRGPKTVSSAEGNR